MLTVYFNHKAKRQFSLKENIPMSLRLSKLVFIEKIFVDFFFDFYKIFLSKGVGEKIFSGKNWVGLDNEYSAIEKS
uniref:Uncharacterized protein n=1 Tax=candidate division CPR3 bacterium TaxID=2268181 RepID=A0A7V3N557_UNCC3